MPHYNVKGGKFDPKSASCREFNIIEIHQLLAMSGPSRAWSWGFDKGTSVLPDLVYRFTVNGHLHKGYVYITLAWSDTFSIFYTDKSNTIVKISDMVYVDELVDTIDRDVERIPAYTH